MNYEARIGTDGIGQEVPVAASWADRARRKPWLAGLVAVLLLGGLYYWAHRGEDEDSAADTARQAATVSVITPGRATIPGIINVTGTIAARREMPVGSVGEGGQVVDVRVEAGDWVHRGQVLAVVDRSVQVQQQASQSAQVEVAAANARLAQANLDRALKLVDRGFISRADVDRLTATRDAAVAQVNVARAQLGQLRAQAGRLNILAPEDGLVLERGVERGQVVGAGSGVLFRIAKGGELEILARVSETDLAGLSPGIQAKVTPVGSSRSFTGQVWQVSPVIDPATRQGTARVALAYAPELRPGGFASVEIASGTVVAPKLPESALMSDANGAFVYVVGPGNKVERRTVKTGTVSADGIAVISGLSGGERVVLRAGGFLQPGETVNPKPAAAAAR
ncbi:efflux RND transporter periplasmic adaptor subunit [Novosphingobium flavum]|uniref:Efflux RND transporter periplasmic adaptor subunit n=1 Tax=Novosphingobium flavum TaxID=1778672 RepID=A0A7X1FPD1_9SPHN|nr:efflux RND transporter periplasmic adaptor subunit [Novosphingobium flavum]MBC2664488.1 efflux RND transporter periplasmic adaptor subunit [Novosphingobium flavum]